MSQRIIYIIIFCLSNIPVFAQISYWEPSEPESGDAITIYYDAEQGTIPANTAQLKLHWGINQVGAGGWVQPPQSMWPDGSVPWNDGVAVQSPMSKNEDDLWTITIQTEASTASLHYVVTNGNSWDNNGGRNWDIIMGEPPARDMTWHTFYYDTRSTYAIYGVDDFENIYVAGSFNNWSSDTYLMQGPDENGVYKLDVHLPAGVTTYKYVINGNTWLADPDNPHFDGSRYGNSIDTLFQSEKPSFWNIMPKSGTLFEPEDEFTVSGTIRPADTGGEQSGSATMHFGEAEYDLTFNRHSGVIEPIDLVIPDDLAQGRYELSFEVTDDRDSTTVHNVPIGVYESNTGFHYVDASGDDDGYGSFMHPEETHTADILSFSITEAGGGDSLKISIQMGEGDIMTTVLELNIRSEISGLPFVYSYWHLEMGHPYESGLSESFALCHPQSPNFIKWRHNDKLNIDRNLLESRNVYEFYISSSNIDRQLWEGYNTWYISLFSFYKDSSIDYGLEVTKEFGGIAEEHEPDVWDLLFTDNSDLQHRLLGNYSLNRMATLDNPGRGFVKVELSDISDNMGITEPWVEILTQKTRTVRSDFTLWGVVHSDFPVDVTINQTSILGSISYELQSVIDTFRVDVEVEIPGYGTIDNHFSATIDVDDEAVYTSPWTIIESYEPREPLVISGRKQGNRVFLSSFDTLDYTPFDHWHWEADPSNPQPIWIQNSNQYEINFLIPSKIGDYIVNCNRKDSRSGQTVFTVNNDSIDFFEIDESVKWVKEAIVYEIFPRSFSPSQQLSAITDDLERIKDLGANTIWLMPINPGPTNHGYEIMDYYGIEEDIGTEDDFRELVNRAHDLDLKVILDMVINHSSIQHPFMRHAMRNGEISPYWDWYERNPDGSHKFYYDWYNLPNLNFDNPDVREYFIKMSLDWVQKYDIDGFRCDVAWGPQERNSQFWKEWRTALKSIKPDLLLLGEASSNDWGILNDRFDLAYDWALHHEGVSSFINMFPRVASLDNLHQLITNYGVGWPDHKGAFRFIENHDEQRFIDFNTVKQTKLAATLLFTIPGVPMISAGQEIGEKSQRGLINWSADPDSLLPFYKSLTSARNRLPALVYGDVVRLGANQSMIYAMGRHRYILGEERVVVAANFMSNPLPDSKIYLPLFDWMLEHYSTYKITDEMSGDIRYMLGHEIDTLNIYLDAYSARIFSIADSVTVIPEPEPEPFTYFLDQCYPNPFNQGTIINFGIADNAEVSINIYDVTGRLVAKLINGDLKAGNHSIYWNGESLTGTDISNGIYFYRIKADSFTKTNKMVLVK